MKSQNSSIFDEIPLVNEFSIVTNTPNEDKLVYEGPFELKSDQNAIQVNGKIEFKWFPITGLVFIGTITKLSINELPKFGKYDLYISSKKCGKAELVSFNEEFKSSECIKLIKGIISKFYNGDITQEVSQVKFAIPNMKYLIGENVKKLEPKKRSLGKNRIRIYDNDYFLEIDKLFENDRIEDLKQKGGYHITHIGVLSKQKGTINRQEFKVWYDLFYFFLCFINGRRTAPLFCSGYIEDKIIWKDYDFYNLEAYKNYICWSDIEFYKIEYSTIWNKYFEICKDNIDKECISILIHWYLESNTISAKLEASIILTQTGLELLYNWKIRGNNLNSNDDSINASEKISKIIDWLNLSKKIPNEFQELQKHAQGPEIITEIRNALVHSNMIKISKLLDISKTAKYQALQLGLWYLELGILKVLGHKGYYKNRITGKIENVPWEIKIKVDEPLKYGNEKLQEFLEILNLQGKNKTLNINHIKSCLLLGIAEVDGKIISIGTVKPKKSKVFKKEKANCPKLEWKIDYEVGYFFTSDKYRGQGLSSKILDKLLEKYPSKNFYATTEIRHNNPMIKILENKGFKQFGKEWPSILNNEVNMGLFLKIEKEGNKKNPI